MHRGSDLTAALLAVAALASGCTFLGTAAPGVSFATDPPGARVLVDRKDSGFVTPCRLTMPEGERHDVELRMPGYQSVLLQVDYDRRADVILWRDMYVRPEVWKFPLWLPLEDFFEPVKVHRTYVPGHVFVRLDRDGSP